MQNANRLSTTMQDLLHLMNEFRKMHDLNKDVTVRFADDQLQKTEQTLEAYFSFIFMYTFSIQWKTIK